MKLFWGLGKILIFGFWVVVLVSHLVVLPSPFDVLIKGVGGLVLLAHILELFFFRRRLHGRRHPWSDRLQILLFGIFHLQSIPVPSAEASHA